MITYLSRDFCNSLKEKGIIERAYGGALAILSRLLKKGFWPLEANLAGQERKVAR
jgi:hypothetical protein